ncbi:MAG: hypothetical protein A3205_06760 [Methanomassiliicoccales archaeon Mx-03]|nr:MAG: hypothetical protein A3205_06760 [Methanomassiliicoccales archaeon Mx-03]
MWKTWGFRSVRTALWMNENIVCSMILLQSMVFPEDSSNFARTQAMAALWACLSSSVRSTGRMWSFQRFMFAELKNR